MHLTRTLMSLAAAVVSAVSSFAVNGAEDPEIKELSDGSTVAIFRNTSTPYEWTVPSGVTSVRYLVVGGGGSGASGGTNMYGAGGGAGGLLAGDALAVSGTLRITVGAGGESVAGSRSGGSSNGNQGTDSTVFAGETELLRAYGGGYGGGYVDKARQVGGDGGSGGGGGPAGGSAASMAGGKGVEGQGVDGGASSKADGVAGTGGGLSFVSNITGAPVTYAVGGAGGALATPGAGAAGADGTGNGGAGGSGASNASGKGGDGIVILRYTLSSDIDLSNATVTVTPTSATHTGEEIDAPTVTVTVDDEVVDPSHYTLAWNPAVLKDVGSYDLTVMAQGAGYTGSKTVPGAFTITEKPVGDDWGYEFALGSDTVRVYTNTASAGFTWTVPSDVTSVRYLVVGGGGGGGYGGGGGGYALDGTASVQPGAVLAVSVGAGGAGGADGANGTKGCDSSLSRALEVTAKGGGYGGGVNQDGGAGGCGGGGAKKYSGGSCTQGPSGYGGTGGGSSFSGSGAGVTGRNSKANEKMAEGGAGLVSSITGADVEYGKGGQGQTTSTPATGTAGEDGTGTGGGGSRSGAGAKGGDGVVILRYATAQRSRGIMLIFN